jgi:hypothetical protein
MVRIGLDLRVPTLSMYSSNSMDKLQARLIVTKDASQV